MCFYIFFFVCVYIKGLSYLLALKYISGLFNKIWGEKKPNIWWGKMNITFPRQRKSQKHIILKNTDQECKNIIKTDCTYIFYRIRFYSE